jgi:hypothetical protein
MKRDRRHPAEVTADRLLDHAINPAMTFDGRERDAIGLVIFALREIAEGNR